jgi:hypothetical protein
MHKSADQEAAAEAAVIRSHAHTHTIPVAALGVPQDAVRDDECASQLRPKGPLVGRSSSFSRAIHRIGEESDRIYRISSAPEVTPLPQVSEAKQFRDRQGSLQDELQLSEKQKHNKDVMQVFMLEVGILFHSVFIGMSLSVSVGNEFVILLIAIVFHRKLIFQLSSVAVPLIQTETFEGLALGSRIACLDWPAKAAQPWLMSLAYGCTYVSLV